MYRTENTKLNNSIYSVDSIWKKLESNAYKRESKHKDLGYFYEDNLNLYIPDDILDLIYRYVHGSYMYDIIYEITSGIIKYHDLHYYPHITLCIDWKRIRFNYSFYGKVMNDIINKKIKIITRKELNDDRYETPSLEWNSGQDEWRDN